MLMGWQERMQAMAEEMKSVLEVLPMDATEDEEGESQQSKPRDKGKAPVEGIHAQSGM